MAPGPRAGGLAESISVLLVANACNVGLTPVADEDYPPLTRDRLNWTAQNYVRSATHTGASTRLFDFHAGLDLACDSWGGGDMASADGMRFVIPVSTIHAGYNPRYFGRQRGSTLYTGWPTPTPRVAAFGQYLFLCSPVAVGGDRTLHGPRVLRGSRLTSCRRLSTARNLECKGEDDDHSDGRPRGERFGRPSGRSLR